VLGVVLAQSGVVGLDHLIAFSSKKMSTTEQNYISMEYEGLAMVYALYKFRLYLLGLHFKMYTDHFVLRYLVNNPVLGGNICIWLLLFHKYDFEVIEKQEKLNLGPNHLSRILTGEDAENLDNSLPNVHLFLVHMVDDYFAKIVQFLNTGVAPLNFTTTQKKQLVVKAENYKLIYGNLYNLGADNILRRCALEHERHMILSDSHGGFVGGHYGGKVIAQNIFHAGLWWPTLHKDVGLLRGGVNQ
jgi:hypothetical protein